VEGGGWWVKGKGKRVAGNWDRVARVAVDRAMTQMTQVRALRAQRPGGSRDDAMRREAMAWGLVMLGGIRDVVDFGGRR
jgi:hypothetical protein